MPCPVAVALSAPSRGHDVRRCHLVRQVGVGGTALQWLPQAPQIYIFLEVFTVINLIFRFPKALFFMVLGAHGGVIPTWSLTIRPLKVTETQKERIVFQPSFCRVNSLLNFGSVFCFYCKSGGFVYWKFCQKKTWPSNCDVLRGLLKLLKYLKSWLLSQWGFILSQCGPLQDFFRGVGVFVGHDFFSGSGWSA